MVRRADPRVGRACARATQGASQFRTASLPPVSARPVVSSLGPRNGRQNRLQANEADRRCSSWRLREIRHALTSGRMPCRAGRDPLSAARAATDYALGWSDQSVDVYARAMQRANQALLLNPDQATAHYAKARLIMFKAKPDDAASANQVIAEAEAALRADPSYGQGPLADGRRARIPGPL